MFGMFVFGMWSAGVLWWTYKNTRRSREHQPRALKLLEAPKKSEPINFDDINELLRKIRENAEKQSNYRRPPPTSMPGPPERRRG
jgi:cbb3-type cytochrome oxidase subunit 3